MTGYLQRLFDRTAALAGGAPQAGEGQPAMRPGSPLARFDQRLAAPELAGDFTFGVGYETGIEDDGAQDPTGDPSPAALRPAVQPLPPLPAAPQSRRSPAGDAVPALRPVAQPAAPPAALPVSEGLRSMPAEPSHRASVPDPGNAAERAPQPLTPAPRTAPAQPPVTAQPWGRAGQADPSPAPERHRAEPAKRQHARVTEARARPQPDPASPVPQSETLRAHAASAVQPGEPVVVPLPSVQPARAGMEPPALPQGEPIDWREVDRRIAAAIERQQTVGEAQARRRETSAQADQAPASEPAPRAPVLKSAAETSMIGSIEPPRRPRMLFGERLR